jgi:hypothetical protein
MPAFLSSGANLQAHELSMELTNMCAGKNKANRAIGGTNPINNSLAICLTWELLQSQKGIGPPGYWQHCWESSTVKSGLCQCDFFFFFFFVRCSVLSFVGKSDFWKK